MPEASLLAFGKLELALRRMVSIPPSDQAHLWFEAVTPAIFGFRLPPNMSDSALEQYCAWFSDWYANQAEPLGMICDLSRALVISPRQRAIWTAFEKRSAGDFARVLRGVAIVLTNPVSRGVVTAAYWMNRPVYDWRIVSTWTDGRTWLAPRLVASCRSGA